MLNDCLSFVQKCYHMPPFFMSNDVYLLFCIRILPLFILNQEIIVNVVYYENKKVGDLKFPLDHQIFLSLL